MNLYDVNNWIRDRLAEREIILVHYKGSGRRERIEQVRRLKAQRKLLLNHCEIFQILSALEATARIPGDLAELGVAYGASAKLLSEYASEGKTLHLFDTFEGLPEPVNGDSVRFYKGEFGCSFDDVREWLAGMRVELHKGLFPGTADAVRDKRFSFVHLDADLYESTIEGLRFFYPRMSTGGILISHDYLNADGVTQAFREYFADKPEPVIELIGFQCMVVKL